MNGSVVLAGAFGQSNPGDEALLTAFSRALDDWSIVATSDDADATTAEHGVDAVHRFDNSRVASRLRRSDAVVVAGGTVFKTLHPSCGRRRHALLERATALTLGARALGKPLALVGVGAHGVGDRRARLMARTVAKQSSLLILRDEESADVLEAAGAPAPMRVGADAAWTLFDGPSSARDAASDRVVVALSHLAGGPALAEELAAGLAPLLAAGLPVCLQPWQTDANGSSDDTLLAHAVAARLPGAEIVPAPADLLAARDEFASARLVVGLRFHALIAAAAAGTPFVAVAHEAKLGALARRLDQPCVEPSDLRSRLAPLVLAAASADDAGPSAQVVGTEIVRARESLRLLRVLLSAGASDEADGVDGLDLAPEGWHI